MVEVNAYGVTTAAGDSAAVSFQTLVQVPKSCPCINNAVSLAVQRIGSSGTIDLANAVVTKLG